MIILDFGSGNTCRNEWPIAKRMIDALAEIDKERKCVIKWQLFEDAFPNIPLHERIFSDAYDYAKGLGFKTAASVFDLEMLGFLLGNFDIPFVKIANRRDLDWLIGEVPRKIPVYVSVGSVMEWVLKTTVDHATALICASKYPASIEDYEGMLGIRDTILKMGISDHTTDWTLYRKYQPEIYEVHFKLDDSTGPDAGPFARTPEQLKEIL